MQMDLSQGQIQIIIPECCRMNLDTCAHVPKRQRKTKVNIGL